MDTQSMSASCRSFAAPTLGMNRYELVDLGSGAMLHDVGKLFTPKEILAKPEPLNADEIEVIHRHPWDGFQVLRKHMPLIPPAHVAFQHHERYDGSGYPRGLLDADTLDLAKSSPSPIRTKP